MREQILTSLAALKIIFRDEIFKSEIDSFEDAENLETFFQTNKLSDDKLTAEIANLLAIAASNPEQTDEAINTLFACRNLITLYENWEAGLKNLSPLERQQRLKRIKDDNDSETDPNVIEISHHLKKYLNDDLSVNYIELLNFLLSDKCDATDFFEFALEKVPDFFPKQNSLNFPTTSSNFFQTVSFDTCEELIKKHQLTELKENLDTLKSLRNVLAPDELTHNLKQLHVTIMQKTQNTFLEKLDPLLREQIRKEYQQIVEHKLDNLEKNFNEHETKPGYIFYLITIKELISPTNQETFNEALKQYTLNKPPKNQEWINEMKNQKPNSNQYNKKRNIDAVGSEQILEYKKPA